ncbi:hypothetical protein IFO70_24345 [Phormidium tenue FACHB-886]|nr:hypothetical protein [Phormidium tenue FACHB-886]
MVLSLNGFELVGQALQRNLMLNRSNCNFSTHSSFYPLKRNHAAHLSESQLSLYSSSPKPYVKPRALSWRYQVAREHYSTTIVPKPHVELCAINWRYQLAARL